MHCLSCNTFTDRPLCTLCATELEEQIAEIVDRYSKLDATPTSGGMDGGRRAPGFGSKPPVNLHIVALRDPRSLPRQLGDIHNAEVLLSDWANYVRMERGQAPRSCSLVDSATYLVANIDWLSRQEWILDLRAQVKAVVMQLRSATGEPNPKPVGHCTCGEPLYWAPGSSEARVKCSACSEVYEPLALLEQALQAQEGATDVAS